MYFVGRVYLEVECHDTIAAMDILQGIGIRAWLGVGLAVPGEALTCANGVVGLVGGVILANHAVGVEHKAESTAT